MRSLAREYVFKYLFSRLFNPSDEGLFDVLIKDLSNSDKNFAVELKNAVLTGEQKYLDLLSKYSSSYQLNRIFNTDKCAILIGMAELDNFRETPIPVVIDEAVKLAAVFSAEKSTDYVNGILAEFCRENRND